MPGEAGDVHLVDDHVLHRAAERLVTLPVIVVHVDDDAPHRRRQVVGRSHGIVTVEKPRGSAQRVWVDQHLVAVEAKPLTEEIAGPSTPYA